MSLEYCLHFVQLWKAGLGYSKLYTEAKGHGIISHVNQSHIHGSVDWWYIVHYDSLACIHYQHQWQGGLRRHALIAALILDPLQYTLHTWAGVPCARYAGSWEIVPLLDKVDLDGLAIECDLPRRMPTINFQTRSQRQPGFFLGVVKTCAHASWALLFSLCCHRSKLRPGRAPSQETRAWPDLAIQWSLRLLFCHAYPGKGATLRHARD